MDQVAPDHAIGIGHQVIERLLFSWYEEELGFLCSVEDGNDLRVSLDQPSQACLLLSDALVAIKIKPNGTGLGLNRIADGTTQHGIVDRPSVVADVPLVDSHNVGCRWVSRGP